MVTDVVVVGHLKTDGKCLIKRLNKSVYNNVIMGQLQYHTNNLQAV